MEFQKLDIILHYAKGLLEVKSFGTMDPYVVVWITSDSKKPKPCTTDIATNGGHSSVWNYPMQFDVVPMHMTNCILFCEIRHNGTLFDQKIGHVQVPFTNLLARDASGKELSYPVMTSAGEIEGEIVISHEFSKGDPKDNSNSSSSSDHGNTFQKGKGKSKKLKELALRLAILVGEIGLEITIDVVRSLFQGATDSSDDEDEDCR